MRAISQRTLSNPFQLMNAYIEAIRDYTWSHIRAAFNIVQCQSGIMVTSLHEKYCSWAWWKSVFSKKFGLPRLASLCVSYRGSCGWLPTSAMLLLAKTRITSCTPVGFSQRSILRAQTFRNWAVVLELVLFWSNVYSNYGERNLFFCNHLDMFNFTYFMCDPV